MDTTMPSILVVGSTGTVGREVMRALAERRVPVRVLVRSEERAKGLPGDVTPCVGNLHDQASVERALQGARAALFIAPHDDAEERLAEEFVSLCEAGGVRLVYLGTHVDGASKFTRALMRTLYGFFMPHYKAKFRMSERARTSKANAIVLSPSNFFQNDELCRAEILAGSYPQPMALVNRIDVRDIGDICARALIDDGLPAGGYPLVGPASLSGVECAKLWSEALGKSVTYTGDDITIWDQILARQMDKKKSSDFQRTYHAIKSFKVKTTDSQVASMTKLLGRPARSYREYIQDTAKEWRGTS